MDEFNQRVANAVAGLRCADEHVTPDLRVNPRGAARLIGVAVGTLRNWRSHGEGPNWIKAGQVWYRVPDILRWLDAQVAKDWADAAA